jgi:sterol desaturase/sphingolipid hydroxylase (fatty acid hydroxylase superfamily)
MKRWFSACYAPGFAGIFIATAVVAVDVLQLPSVWLLALFGVAVGCAFWAEWLLPFERDWNRSQGDRARDLAHAIVNEGLNVLAVAAVPVLAALRPWASAWPVELPFVLQLLIAMVVADAGITLAHWASHRWALLWRLHAVHHSVRRMYGFNGLMKHPAHQAVEALAGISPLLMLGMPADVAAVLAFAIAIQLLLQHGNVDMRSGPLDRIFCWAPLHRFHHLRYGRAGDVNFGLFLTVWDHLLGTAFDGGGYRVASHDLGIGSRPDYPRRYGAQLLEPFRVPRDQSVPAPPPDLAQSIARSRSPRKV